VADLTYDNPSGLKSSGGALLREEIPYIIQDGLQLYVGMLGKLSSGQLVKMASGGGKTTPCVGIIVGPGVPGSNPVMDGFALGTLPIPTIAKGNVSSAAAGNANRAIVNTGEFVLEQVTLTLTGSMAGSGADVGIALYASTSNPADLTSVQPGSDPVIGEIKEFLSKPSGTTAIYHVLVYSLEARRS